MKTLHAEPVKIDPEWDQDKYDDLKKENVFRFQK